MEENSFFPLLCAITGLIFLHCLIPCFIKLIGTVVQGVQVTTLPTDVKFASKASSEKRMVLPNARKIKNQTKLKDGEKISIMLQEFEKGKMYNS